MIRLIGRKLIIPQGDTGSFTIPTLGTIDAGDKAIFAIYDNLTHVTVCEKSIEIIEPSETLVFNFVPEDTINIEADDKGRRYTWDIVIMRKPYQDENDNTQYEEVDSYYAAFKLPPCAIRRVTRNV